MPNGTYGGVRGRETKVIGGKLQESFVLLLLDVRPARTYSNGRKSPNRPDSGKVTVKGKGVHREVESEGSRRQTVGPMNKNLVEGWKAGVMLLEKQKPDNYPNCRQ